MKAVSSIIAIILILMIVIAIASLFYIFSSTMFSSITQTGSSNIAKLTETLSSCMKIDSIYQNKIYLRNCGQGVITNDSLNIYVDNTLSSFNMSPVTINKGELTTITMPLWGLSIGNHNLKITNPYTQIAKTVESVLPDSCILALDFDEGSGDIVSDKSGKNNNGKLGNSTTATKPTWTNGKYGNGLNLNGSQFVNISLSSSLEITKVTIEAWIKPYSTGFSQNVLCRGADVYNLWFDWGTPIHFSMRDIPYYPVPFDITSDFQVRWDSWQHVLVNYDGTNAKFYLNGTENIKSFSHGDINTSLDMRPIYIGMHSYGLNNYFNGTIDSVRVYNKVLTPDETVILKMK